jgi:Fur family ferric uptake transcriptional regulator
MSDDLASRLREQGLRLTPQRQLILRAVEELRHATPDEVLAHVRAQVSSVNPSTVYRTLEVLEELGLVRHTHLSDRAPTYHSTLEHEHVHVVCRSYDPALVGSLVAALGADGFSVDVGHLAIFGECADCSAATGSPEAT